VWVWVWVWVRVWVWVLMWVWVWVLMWVWVWAGRAGGCTPTPLRTNVKKKSTKKRPLADELRPCLEVELIAVEAHHEFEHVCQPDRPCALDHQASDNVVG